MYYDSEQEFDYGEEPYGSDQGDSEDDWRTDIGNFQTEYIDRERAGATIGCWLTGSDGKPLKIQDAKGKFCLKVDAVSRNIDSSCDYISISEDQIQELLNKSQELERIEFLNSTAFVLGFLVTNGGRRSITKTYLNNIWKCYDSLMTKDKSVKKPDIIRYARLWMSS
jgi:hypothetical protein